MTKTVVRNQVLQWLISMVGSSVFGTTSRTSGYGELFICSTFPSTNEKSSESISMEMTSALIWSLDSAEMLCWPCSFELAVVNVAGSFSASFKTVGNLEECASDIVQ
ncbi:hypothetical protein WICPIJ_000402 [Wickerhamomyces pijperi]|uniref:Uncharacterized protein n=1 Tax=Wickerhamomyces pijperi TaxID=599730 RepID=A0A9P8QH41_WICPI|nr:hypothetical protein WICPIJ_000402 [Wickerhamomyces pijperi]